MKTFREIIKVGAVIIDTNGRRGVITEVREDIGGFFARPADKKYVETMDIPGVGAAQTIMATDFHPVGDGSYKGIWVDAKLDEWVNVRIVED